MKDETKEVWYKDQLMEYSGRLSDDGEAILEAGDGEFVTVPAEELAGGAVLSAEAAVPLFMLRYGVMGPVKAYYMYRYNQRWKRTIDIMDTPEQILGILLMSKYTDCLFLAKWVQKKWAHTHRIKRHIKGVKNIIECGLPVKQVGQCFHMNGIKYRMKEINDDGTVKLEWKERWKKWNGFKKRDPEKVRAYNTE